MYLHIAFGSSFAFLVIFFSYSFVIVLVNVLTWFLILLYCNLTAGSLVSIAFLLRQCFFLIFASAFLLYGIPSFFYQFLWSLLGHSYQKYFSFFP